MSQPCKICPRCQTPADLQAPTCSNCGRIYKTAFPQNPDRTVLGAGNAPGPADPTTYQPAPAYQPGPSYHPQQYEQPYEQPYQQQYQQQYQPAPQVVYHVEAPRQKTDACAILSVVFGGVALGFMCLFGWVFGIASIALGVVSLTRLRGNPQLTGAPMAITGIALSVIPVALGLWGLSVWAQASAEVARDNERERNSAPISQPFR